MSKIHGSFKHTSGAFTLDAEFTIPNRGVTGIFGPSGAGKSTLLRCIAGLTRARIATLTVGDETWQDESRRVFMPVHQRSLGYVFQEASLFPHLSVRENILFGFKRIPAAQRAISMDQAIAWTGIGAMLDRMPTGLSGGERQRVAIARALLASPKLLLMDEPLASLDEPSRAELMPYLEGLHRDLSIPLLLVSHSLREIARLADTLLVLRGGHVTECGPLQSLLPRVYTESGAVHEDAFAVLDATVARHDAPYHLTELQTVFGPMWAGEVSAVSGENVRIQIAARDVSIGKAVEAQSSIVNQFQVRIASHTARPPGNVIVALVPVQAPEAAPLLSLITRRSWDQMALEIGMTVFARVKGVSIVR
ncbi:MAG TPA: molybdenum ABC transporter ATP-binding protein [Candidatus Hydrogenedentes bacterium]|nr:molybdenum ABC transporter ATP-binding protein [Candidatus Hydrogenedentota bacterium]HRK33463.1 molybdenum ABC transporter ATP-binding protein [Candidatus Hydrogenedentota bacterium]